MYIDTYTNRSSSRPVKPFPKIALLFLLIAFFPFRLTSQDSLQYRKLYLHTDREIYFPGDSVWFKAYYLDGNSHQFVTGIYNMYSDLFDKNGNQVYSQVLPIVNGVAAGRLVIPDSIEPGDYVMRAFTDLQRNFGEDIFFYKTLKVSSIISSVEETVQNPKEGLKKIEIAFLPEGGYLLAGQSNVVGIKAIDKSGRGISVKGEVLNGDGETVSVFETKYKGMDTIHITPRRNGTYQVKIEGFPEYNYEFNDIRRESLKLEFITESRYELLFRATSNSKRFLGNEYTFVIMHRGEVMYQQRFVQEEENIPIKVNRSVLPGGINRFVLLDDQLRPISERLCYVMKDELHDIQIRSDEESYRTRSEVKLELFDELGTYGGAFSSLSLAVVDEKSLGKDGPEMNIRSWLLIDSELKGIIESPSDYFKDDESISSKEKLDLLMLTQGWSKYIWNAFPEKDYPADFIEEEGFSISGNVTRNFSKRAVVNGKVSLTIFNNEYIYTKETRTDINGRYSFDKLTFSDTASIFIQAWDEKEKRYSRVEINPLFKENPVISRIYLPTPEVTSEIPVELQRQQYYNEMSLREYIMKTGSFFIEEVEVVAEKGDGIDRRLYSKPASSLKVTMADYSYPDVFRYLNGRVPGLSVSYVQADSVGGLEPQIRIRQFGSTYGSTDVLFLLNGIPVSKEVIQYLPMPDIDVIDVLKSIGETAIFGIGGANGVIAVYTKRGLSDEEYNADPVGIISEKICGYSAFREFYSPSYTPETIHSERPDHRITLYWNPNIVVENGKASVSFYTSDDLSGYKVFVEGITNTGEICLGTGKFEVDIRGL